MAKALDIKGPTASILELRTVKRKCSTCKEWLALNRDNFQYSKRDYFGFGSRCEGCRGVLLWRLGYNTAKMKYRKEVRNATS